jgi:hypothetical protein
MRGPWTVILQACFPAICRAIAARQVLGIMTVLGALAWTRPASVAAQAIGTLQVEARVTGADSEWSSLRAAQQLAGDSSAAASNPAGPFRLALPLSEIQLVPRKTVGVGNGQPAKISIQYLRN